MKSNDLLSKIINRIKENNEHKKAKRREDDLAAANRGDYSFLNRTPWDAKILIGICLTPLVALIIAVSSTICPDTKETAPLPTAAAAKSVEKATAEPAIQTSIAIIDTPTDKVTARPSSLHGTVAQSKEYPAL